jgi:hypothetical protein
MELANITHSMLRKIEVKVLLSALQQQTGQLQQKEKQTKLDTQQVCWAAA